MFFVLQLFYRDCLGGLLENKVFKAIYWGREGNLLLALQQGANPTHCNTQGKTPLIYALETLQFNMVHMLLDYGAWVEVRDPTYNESPLIMAAPCHCAKDVVHDLLWHGAHVNAKSGVKGNYTALMRASQYGRLEIVQLLLDVGADVNSQDNKGYTALMW